MGRGQHLVPQTHTFPNILRIINAQSQEAPESQADGEDEGDTTNLTEGNDAEEEYGEEEEEGDNGNSAGEEQQTNAQEEERDDPPKAENTDENSSDSDEDFDLLATQFSRNFSSSVRSSIAARFPPHNRLQKPFVFQSTCSSHHSIPS